MKKYVCVECGTCYFFKKICFGQSSSENTCHQRMPKDLYDFDCLTYISGADCQRDEFLKQKYYEHCNYYFSRDLVDKIVRDYIKEKGE